MALLTEALTYCRANGPLGTLRRIGQLYGRSERRYYLTWDDFVGPSALPLDPGPLTFRLARPDDASRLTAFSHVPPARLAAWLGPDYVFALALKSDEPIGYYCFAPRAPVSVRPAVRVRADELFAVEIFTVPSVRRQGVTRHFRIAMARILSARGFRGTWGLHDPLNHLAVDAADRLPALTVRTGTLTRRSLLGWVRFAFDAAMPLSSERLAAPRRLLGEILGHGSHRIAVLVNPGSVLLPPAVSGEAVSAPGNLDGDVIVAAVREREEQRQAFDTVFARLADIRPDGLLVLHDPMFAQHRRTIVALASGLGVPTVYEGVAFARAGGALACSPPRGIVPEAVRAAVGGDPPGHVAVNLRGARRLGLALPETLLRRAQRVIA